MASAGDVVCNGGCRSLSNRLDNCTQIKQLKNACPVLIIHGKQDDDVPYRNALILYSACRDKLAKEGFDPHSETSTVDEKKNELKMIGPLGLLTLEDGQHNDLDTYCAAEMMSTVIRWLRENCGGFENCSVENRNARTIKKSKAERLEMVF